ncbi:MAG: ADP-glyceromanno-heptose 6-epimerase [Pseudomonadota bacterium]
MYLITGGAGFIGTNIAHALHGRRQEIVICDRFTHPQKQHNIIGLDDPQIVVPAHLDAWLHDNAAKLTGIIHMGAISDTRCRDIDALLQDNFALSCMLWKVACDQQVPFFYASSAATYGSLRYCIDDNDPNIMRQLQPNNAYGWSKQIFDLYTLHAKQTPPQWVGLKFFNVFGPYEHHKGPQSSVVLQFWQQLQQGDSITLFHSADPQVPDNSMARDFVWVGDCVAIMLWLLEQNHISGIFNCGSGQATPFETIARSVIRHTRTDAHIRYSPMPHDIAQHYQYCTQASLKGLHAAGYKATPTALDEAVGDYIAYLQNRSMA